MNIARKNFFLLGTILGLLLAALLAFAALEQVLLQWLLDLKTCLPILCGALTVLTLGRVLDRKSDIATVPVSRLSLASPLIFIAGALLASLINFFVSLTYSQAGVLSDFNDYFMKPVFWLLLIGFPASILIGFLWAVLIKKASVAD